MTKERCSSANDDVRANMVLSGDLVVDGVAGAPGDLLSAILEDMDLVKRTEDGVIRC